MVSSTLGSPTRIGWNRRSNAGSFSMCWRYSSRVVAPIARSSPRASIGFSMLPASIAPSGGPAPTRGRRVQHVAGAHRPFGSPRPYQRVQLVDERDDLAFAVDDLLQHRLQAF